MTEARSGRGQYQDSEERQNFAISSSSIPSAKAHLFTARDTMVPGIHSESIGAVAEQCNNACLKLAVIICYST
jgi:hypothetical protein